MIEIQGLKKDFQRKGEAIVHALRTIDLEVERGEFFVLLGPSGSGKTTLLRCVAGLAVPDQGEIVLNGVTVYSNDKRVLVPPERRGLGMVFQSYAIWPHMTVFDNVALPLTQKKPKLAKVEIEKRVSLALSLVGLEGMSRRPAPLLSGGQQQRVALARALATEPTILLMDEPLSNLDARLREEVRKEIRSLATRLGITVLYVTHDQMEAMELADRVAVMHAGMILQEGSPENLYHSPADPRVAQFFGSTNWIDGRLKAKDLVETAVGRLTVSGSRVPDGASNVIIGVRPEDIELAPSPVETGDNLFCGDVVSDAFFGNHRVYTVNIGDQQLLVWVPASLRLIGKVSVRIPPEKICVFRAGSEH
jgi:iron(III) transport system ATP-binding protein